VDVGDNKSNLIHWKKLVTAKRFSGIFLKKARRELVRVVERWRARSVERGMVVPEGPGQIPNRKRVAQLRKTTLKGKIALGPIGTTMRAADEIKEENPNKVKGGPKGKKAGTRKSGQREKKDGTD